MGFFNFFKKKDKKEDEIAEEISEDTLTDEYAEEQENATNNSEAMPETKVQEEVVFEDIKLEVPESSVEKQDVLVEEDLKDDKTKHVINSKEVEGEPLLKEEEAIFGENPPQEEDSTELSSEENQEESLGFFAKLMDSLKKTRDAITNQFQLIVNSFTVIDDELLEELEESLIMADVGTVTALRIVDELRVRIKETGETNPQNLLGMIRDIVAKMLEGDYSLKMDSKPSVILVIGVNGVGKTTSIGKMANQFQKEGKSVLLAAADTFRAAAIEQLEVWADRAGADLVKHQEGSDPAAVVYDAIQAGKARNKDVIIVDTAGRLHNKTHLMDELAKIRRIIDRELPEADIESLLVLDSTTGQNALNQARQFKEVADLTGIILTKLDGTAKGGVVIGIKEELDLPIKFIGVGEQINDLRPFDPIDFSSALFNIKD